MYLQQSTNSSGKVYLSFVQGYRQNGKVKHKTFQYKQRFINAEFNLNSIFSLLTYNRFLFPSSIKHA